MPFGLIGKTVELKPCGPQLQIWYRGEAVAEHPLLPGRHQLRWQPEHGPGAIARNARLRYSQGSTGATAISLPEVEVRDLSLYDQLFAGAGVQVSP